MQSLTHDAQFDNGWAMVTFSTAMCIAGAAVVFIDKLLPQHSSSKPFLERPSFIAATLALSSGVMIFSSLSALLPASLQRIDPDFLTYACFFGGVAFTLVITRIVHFFAPKAVHSCGATDHDDDHLHTPTTLKTPKNDIQTLKGPADSPGERERLLRYQNWDLEYGARNAAGYFDEVHHMHPRSAGSTLISEEADVEEDYFKLGIQTAIAIFVHKFPEGLIMFMSSQASTQLGLSVCIAMSIHNFIEGFMIALPLYIATKSRSNAFWLAAGMGGLSQPLGAVIGLLMMNRVSEHSQDTLFGIIFAGVSGMMTFISVQSMLPQAFKADSRKVPMYFFFGIFLVGLASLLKSL